MDTEKITPITESATPSAQDQAEIYADGFNTLMAASHALIDGCHAVSVEMLAFWQSRIKEGLATGQRLLECDSAEGALEIEIEYAKGALQAYLDQSAKIGDLVSRSLTRSLLPAKHSGPSVPALAA